MQMRISLLLLTSLLCVALASSKNSPTFEELVGRAQRRLVKRDIFYDIRTAIGKLGDSFRNVILQITNYTDTNYQKFKDALKSMLSKIELEKTRDKLSEYYNSFADKTSAKAMRIKDTLGQIKADIAAAGSSSMKSSTLVATVLVVLSIFFLH